MLDNARCRATTRDRPYYAPLVYLVATCVASCRATTRDRPYYATKPPVKPPVILAFGGEMTLHCTFYLIRQQSPAEANTRERGVCWGPFTLSPGQRSPDPGGSHG